MFYREVQTWEEYTSKVYCLEELLITKLRRVCHSAMLYLLEYGGRNFYSSNLDEYPISTLNVLIDLGTGGTGARAPPQDFA